MGASTFFLPEGTLRLAQPPWEKTRKLRLKDVQPRGQGHVVCGSQLLPQGSLLHGPHLRGGEDDQHPSPECREVKVGKLCAWCTWCPGGGGDKPEVPCLSSCLPGPPGPLSPCPCSTSPTTLGAVTKVGAVPPCSPLGLHPCRCPALHGACVLPLGVWPTPDLPSSSRCSGLTLPHVSSPAA